MDMLDAKEQIMSNLIRTIRQALANRRAYNRALAEIAQLDARELNDMRVDRETLVTGAYRAVYGTAR
jgi:uncharacterized protein YjiS (DUF1127 family)